MGKVSFDDCDMFTSSFGCTSAPRRSAARWAITSLAFMLDDVPEPVWNTSMGNCSSCSPAATSSAASAIAGATLLTRAASAFTSPSARTRADGSGSPEIGKFSTARWVWAPQYASAGTRTSPMESCSTRCSATH